MPLGGAWVTPGLVDCHTHLVFGGNRADEHSMRRDGATYEEIARAGGGIASTVDGDAGGDRRRAGRQSRGARLDALMAAACTTVEIKSGYGLDIEQRTANAAMRARALGESEPVRIVADLARAPRACRPSIRTARDDYVGDDRRRD